MFNKRHIVRTIAATVSILALSFTAACGSGQSTASNSTDSDDITQQTYKPGKLTIATGQPAYEPWVMNDKPESGEGYEAAVAYAVADKLGFKKSDVVWTRTAFDTAIAPGAKDWDFNIQQFGNTNHRIQLRLRRVGTRLLYSRRVFAQLLRQPFARFILLSKNNFQSVYLFHLYLQNRLLTKILKIIQSLKSLIEVLSVVEISYIFIG